MQLFAKLVKNSKDLPHCEVFRPALDFSLRLTSEHMELLHLFLLKQFGHYAYTSSCPMYAVEIRCVGNGR